MHVSKLTISGHFAIFRNRKLNSNVRKNKDNIITYRSFKNFDESSFKNDLSEVPWEIVTEFDDINEMVEVWNSLFLEIVNKHTPIKTYRVKRQYQPEWLTTDILECMKKRDRCMINGKTEEYRSLRNKVSTLIDKAKRETYQNKIEEAKNDPRTIWKLLRQFGAGNKHGSSDSNFGIKLNDKLITNEKDVADIFNDFFINVPSKLKEPLIQPSFEPLKNCVNSKIPSDTSFNISLTNVSFVATYLSSLDGSKATGLDLLGRNF